MNPPSERRLPGYPFLDGLRGLAAVMVVCFHIYTFYKVPLPAVDRYLFGWMQCFGHEAVDLFIVLSGFCLALPIVAGKFIRPSEFFLRRAKRILPPYYAAVGLILAVSMLTSDHVAENFNLSNVLSHLTLTHSWFPRWQIAMAGPFWSVAVEAQIYVVFMLVLVPLWRRTNMRIVVLAAWAIGLLPLAMFRAESLIYACPWYLGLFALGMWAADVSVGRPGEPGRRDVIGSGVVATVMMLLCIAVAATGGFAMNFLVLNDTLWGIGFASLLVALTKLSRSRAAQGKAVPMLESRPLLWLGSISYTLYLQHTLILTQVRSVVALLHLNVGLELVMMIGIGVPMSIAVAWGLWWLIERPSLAWQRRGVRSMTIPSEPVSVLTRAA